MNHEFYFVNKLENKWKIVNKGKKGIDEKCFGIQLAKTQILFYLVFYKK